MSSSLRQCTVFALSLVSVVATGRAGDSGLRYYIDGETVVVTNEGKRPDSAVLPQRDTRYDLTLAGRPADPLDAHVAVAARESGLPEKLIRAVVRVESGFDPRAVSPKGARGLMQLMPETARLYGVQDSFDPLQNLRGGARHLRHLLDEFDGDLRLALAAYNAGSTAVRRSGGIPRYRETQNYVRKIHDELGLAPGSRLEGEPRGKPVRVSTTADGTPLLSN